MNILAIIPCRANSSRVPGKNTMVVGGKPNLLWTIEAVEACRHNPHTVVVTDDPHAARIAEKAGVDVLVEPPELAADDNLWHVFGHTMRTVPGTFDAMLLAQPCSPVRPAGMFDRLVERLEHTGCDVVNTLSRVPPHRHPHFLWRLCGDRAVSLALGPVSNSQDFTPVYCSTGMGEIWTWSIALDYARDRWRAARTADMRCIVIESDEWVDIDEPMDVEWAEFLLSRRKRNRETPSCTPEAACHH